MIAQATDPNSAPATWMTLHEASAFLDVAPSTVRRWADAGRIPIRRTEGGHRRFEAAAVRALRAATTTAGRESGSVMTLPQQRPAQTEAPGNRRNHDIQAGVGRY